MDKVVHFEIPVDDVERARKFYKYMFSWKIDKIPDLDYYMVNTVEVDEKYSPKEVGAINGGLLQRTSSTESPLIVIDVPSIDDYLKKAHEIGVNIIMEKKKIGEFGFYARISDTEGNVIAIWEPLK